MFTGRAKHLTIFMGGTDSFQHRALYMAIVQMPRREGCSGVTVIRGVAGFGASSLIHTAGILRLSMDLPIVLMVEDRPARMDRILGPLQEMALGALITIQEFASCRAARCRSRVRWRFPRKSGSSDCRWLMPRAGWSESWDGPK